MEKRTLGRNGLTVSAPRLGCMGMSWSYGPPKEEGEIVPIPGTTRFARLDANLGAASLHLSSDDIATLEETSLQVRIVGARYPEARQTLVGR